MKIIDVLQEFPTEKVTDRGVFEPQPEVLDAVWLFVRTHTEDVGMLMSDVINGDLEVDRLQIELVDSGSLEAAQALSTRLQSLFRDHAYYHCEQAEIDYMDWFRTPPSDH